MKATRVRLTSRELLNLRPWIKLNQPVDDVYAAGRIVRHFIEAVENNEQPNEAVLEYVSKAVKRAQGAKPGALAKELGLKRPGAGNPGGVQRGRRLTPGDKEEIPVLFAERMRRFADRPVRRGAGSWRDRIVGELAAEYRVGRRTIERYLALCQGKS